MTHPGGDTGRLIIVSNRLPIRVKRTPDGFTYRQSVGGLATGLSAIYGDRNVRWLGWPGVATRDEKAKAEIERCLRKQYNCQPLFIPRRDFDGFYGGLSNGCLWPLFHYFTGNVSYDPKEWRAYEKVNRLFRDKLVEMARPGDRFWIHDYHLLLLPGMLREKLPDAPIGFFLHIPFPSFEILRMMPWRERILEGMLGADLIGFHTYSYARHFLSSLLRLMGLENEFGRTLVGERPVKIDIFPLGVDAEHFAAMHERPDVRGHLADLRAKTEQRKVILSVDRLDFTKGIIERLRAYECFLEHHPEWSDRVVLILLCVPSRTNVPEYAALKRRVDEVVGNINGRFARPGWDPIWYLYRSLPVEELSALYLAADVAIVTPLRDGMNLISKEYIATRTDGTGVLILSETAGSAEELGEAIIVNPRNVEGAAKAIHRALTMPQHAQQARNQRLLARVNQYDNAQWAGDFLGQLEAVVRERPMYRRDRFIEATCRGMVKDYRRAERRLLLLDYDGTLVPFSDRPEGATPDEEIKALLSALVKDARNTVVVVSGRSHASLWRWLGDVGVDLVAEHGARWRRHGDAWKLSPGAVREDWRRSIRPVLEVFASRTPGAYLEDKETALVWHYRTADPELGAQRALELNGILQSYVINTPLHVIQGAKQLEVKSGDVNKGRAVRRWLRRRPAHDFILAIGDDATDEDMFRALPARAWTIKVGLAASLGAKFFVRDVAEARKVLRRLGRRG
jgi:trehalose 6-phosphate synthase/phosphatase